MESGEKELRQAFEDVTTNNVKTVVEFSQETRKIVRDLEAKILKLEEIVRGQNEAIDGLRVQLAIVQARVYSGGT